MPYLAIFTGNAHPELAKTVADHLHIPLGKADVARFSDGEIAVEINENVRGKDVFILQPTCAPTNDNLMEVMMMADALRRSSAGRITAVMPYFGYARQDRRPRSARVPISAKVVADMMDIVSIDRVMTVDLHSDQIQGLIFLWIICMVRQCCSKICVNKAMKILWWSRLMWAVWCVPEPWQKCWEILTWQSLINAEHVPMKLR